MNAANKQGQTPLHIALQEGRTFPGKVAVMLLQHDVNVNTKDSNSKTALHLHTQRIVQNEGGSGSTLKAILAKGADVNLKDANGQSSLHIACEYNANRRDIIRAILGHGANVNIFDRDSQTPLHIAARRGQTDVCEILVNSGATVNARDKHGHTPAYHAVRGGNIETANWLITKGADMSPIHLSAYQGNLSSLKSLLAGKAAANEKDETGSTALHAAAAGGHRDTVEYLISQGADVEAEGGPGWTALSYAARGNHKEVVEILHANGAGGGKEVSRLLPPVIARGDGEMATILLASSGADINFNNGEPLATAVRCGHKDIVQLLLAKGADVNATDPDRRTPLSYAKEKDHTEIVELLRKHGPKE